MGFGAPGLELSALPGLYQLNWGANLTTVLNFAATNGNSSAPQSPATGAGTDHPIAIAAGRLVALIADTTAADATTVIRVFIDAAPAPGGVLTLSASGPQVIPFSPIEAVTLNQVIAVQYFSGTAPGRSTFGVLVERP